MSLWTLCDWQLALAAHAYESGQTPIMTDDSYERFSALARERDTALPGFQDYTGQWVGELDREMLQLVLEQALDYNQDKDDLHGPAIRAALDDFELPYTCCNRSKGYTCYGD